MKYPRETTIVVLASLLFLSGCAMFNGGDDTTRTKAEGTEAGAITGVVARSLCGTLVGGRRRVRFDHCLEALLFGGSGGYMLGDTVAERKLKYVSEEDRLSGEIDIFKEQNKKLGVYNEKTAQDLKELQARLDEIEKARKGEEGQPGLSISEKERYQKRIEADRNNKVKLESELAALEEYYQSIKNTGDQTKVVALRQEMESLQKNTASLESNSRQMDQLIAAMPVRD